MRNQMKIKRLFRVTNKILVELISVKKSFFSGGEARIFLIVVLLKIMFESCRLTNEPQIAQKVWRSTKTHQETEKKYRSLMIVSVKQSFIQTLSEVLEHVDKIINNVRSSPSSSNNRVVRHLEFDLILPMVL